MPVKKKHKLTIKYITTHKIYVVDMYRTCHCAYTIDLFIIMYTIVILLIIFNFKGTVLNNRLCRTTTTALLWNILIVVVARELEFLPVHFPRDIDDFCMILEN